MILPDVNILVYAHRSDQPEHDRYRRWLTDVINDTPAYGMAEIVLKSFVRIVTNKRIFVEPTPLDQALAAADSLKRPPNCRLISPGLRHWEIFSGLCVTARATGALVTDAYFAALAIESSCEWVTADRDFARFPGLNWRHPFA